MIEVGVRTYPYSCCYAHADFLLLEDLRLQMGQCILIKESGACKSSMEEILGKIDGDRRKQLLSNDERKPKE